MIIIIIIISSIVILIILVVIIIIILVIFFIIIFTIMMIMMTTRMINMTMLLMTIEMKIIKNRFLFLPLLQLLNKTAKMMTSMMTPRTIKMVRMRTELQIAMEVQKMVMKVKL
jgi:hypothetical protein